MKVAKELVTNLPPSLPLTEQKDISPFFAKFNELNLNKDVVVLFCN
jgi:hypothetical protein